MATIFPISSPTSIKDFPAALLNPSSSYTAGINDSKYPYIISEGFHAGSIDFEKFGFTLDAYDGCGFNKYGFYGIVPSPLGALPKVLIASRSFTNAGWGTVQMGEFRVGDNVKEDGGTLVGKSWLRYSNKTGLTIAGPLLRSSSSDVNIIQSPGFDSLLEFDLINFSSSSNSGYLDTPGLVLSPEVARVTPTSEASIMVTGEKVTTGNTIVRGTFLYKASSDFEGAVSIIIKSTESGAEDSSIVDLVKSGEWHKFDYALRLVELSKEPFTIKIQVSSISMGTISLDNWSAYRVFEYATSSDNIPDYLEDKNGVILDSTGLRSFITEDPVNHPEVLTKTFQLNALDGSAYFRGSTLINGYIHSGHLFDSEGNETIDPNLVEGWDGCGINSYGVYGTGFVGTTKTSYFLLAAKDASMIADPYWGSGFSKGELRVGNGVGLNTNNNGLLSEGDYLWFHPQNGLVLSGKIKAGNFLLGSNLDSGSHNGLYLDDNNYWLDGNSTETHGVLKAGGVYITSSAVEIGSIASSTVTIGDNNINNAGNIALTNLTLTGALLLQNSSATNGTPSSYIGLLGASSSSFLSKDGFALGSGNLTSSPTTFTWNAFLLGPTHPWTPSGKSWFYAGDSFNYNNGNCVLGNNYIFFNGSTLKMQGSLHLVGNSDYIHVGSVSGANRGYLSKNALAFYGTSNVVNVLVGTSSHPYLTNYGTSIMAGTNLANHTDPATCPELFRYSEVDGLTIRHNSTDIFTTLDKKTTTYIQSENPKFSNTLINGDMWVNTTDDLNSVATWRTNEWVVSTNGAAEDGETLYVVYHANPVSTIPTKPNTPDGVISGWHSSPTSSDHWMTQKIDKVPVTNKAWGEVIRLTGEVGATGEPGNSGQGVLNATAFKRSSSNSLDTPTGGTYLDPTPNDWEDGIPSGTDPLYMVTRIFTDDGLTPQQDFWSTPEILVNDGESTKVEFSIDESSWHSNPSVSDIYMRVWTLIGTSWDWGSAVKIKGEVGLSTIDLTIYKKTDKDASAPSLSSDISYTITTSTFDFGSSGWLDTIPTTNNTEIVWMRRVSKTTETPEVAIVIGYTEWSDPVTVVQHGDSGVSSTILYCYRKKDATTTITTPSGGTYNFSSNSSTNPSDWSFTLPSWDPETEDVYVSSIMATTSTPDTTINLGTWGTPIIFAKAGASGATGQSINLIYRVSEVAPDTPSPSLGVPVGWFDDPGGAVGAAGGGSTDPLWVSIGKKTTGDYTWQLPSQIEGDAGNSVAEISCYLSASSTPSTPTGGSYDFSTKTLTIVDWTQDVPSWNPTSQKVYLSRATASAPAGGVDSTLSWSSPVVFLEEGPTGPTGPTGTDGVDGVGGGNMIPDGDFELTSSTSDSTYWAFGGSYVSLNTTSGINSTHCAKFISGAGWGDKCRSKVPKPVVNGDKIYFQYMYYAPEGTSASIQAMVYLYDSNKAQLSGNAGYVLKAQSVSSNGWRVVNTVVTVDQAAAKYAGVAFTVTGISSGKYVLIDHAYIGKENRDSSLGAIWGIEGAGIEGLPEFLQSSIPGRTPIHGLNTNNSYLGYYNSSEGKWKVKIDSNGYFYAGDGSTTAGASTRFLYWNNNKLIVAGDIYMYNSYVKNRITVGARTTGNYIEISEGSGSPYIRSLSNTTVTSPGSSTTAYFGWELKNNGYFYCTRVTGRTYNSSGNEVEGYLQLIGTEVGIGTNKPNFAGGLLYINDQEAKICCRATNGDTFTALSASLSDDANENTGHLGFFGSSGTTKQTATGSISNLITILQNYGLIG